MPLIKQVALAERDTLINAFTIPRALPGAVCNIWAYSPPQSKAKYKKTYSLVGYALSAWKALLSEAMVTGDEVLG